MKRVAVTGIGMVTALGSTSEASFEGFVQGRSGVRRLESFDPTGEKVGFGAEIPKEEIERMASELPQEVRTRAGRFVHVSVAAAREALANAGGFHKEESESVGVVTGVGYGNPMPSEGYKVGPTSIIKAMPNAAAAWIAILEGIDGPNMSASAACASGAHAVGIGFDQVRLGRAVAMVAGGVDTVVTRDVVRSFAWLRAINSAKDEKPEEMSRPFDLTRRGFVLGEGAAFLVLEEWEHAKARGAKILAEMMGWGASSDAHHIVAVAPGGVGMAKSMENAIRDARIPKDMIDYVSAHGTSTKMNDLEETRAIRKVFGKHADKLMVSSQKSMIGHTMGGAGAIEAAVTVMTIDKQVVTPTINLKHPDPECDLDYVPNEARKAEVKAAISNSFGFGGHNCVLVFANPQAM